MGLFDFFRRKGGKGPGPEPPEDDDQEEEEEEEEEPVTAVALVREGMSLPSDDEMRELLAEQAPECAELPRHGLSQPHWWKEADWVSGGLRGVARALVGQCENDPDKATFRVVRDGSGARVGIVFLRR